MKDIQILVATHKKYKMPESDIYLPIHVGREGKEDLGYQGDNEGDNISDKNGNYCELTGLYWAWKNLNCKYVGLSHYRRYFVGSKNETFITNYKSASKSILGENEIKELMKNYDIILPKKRNYFIENVRSHYKNAHNIEDLEETQKIINDKYPDYLEAFETVMNKKTLHLYNMFVLKKELFNEYCEWLFDILLELEKRIDISNYDSYQSRIYGFISERLFNVWVEYKQLNVKELKVTNLDKINNFKKANNFILRKLHKVSS
ncbi:DUF4422 domain-containing protein [Priestia flexa]|uniref:DUF4422 domain-containing protein n=1 Tax=Priestia flexa TaxID=86664 RepID=UPI003D2CDE51